MDTFNETEPVGGEDVTSPQDTSAVETQPTNPEEVVDVNQSGEVEEAPELLAGKYKNPKELEKAYQELQHKLGEVGQKAELANLMEKSTGMTHQQIKDYLANQEQQRMAAQVQANPGAYAYQEVQSLKQQIALQNEEKELDSFLQSEEGKAYAPFKDKIFKLGLNLEQDKPYSDIAREYFGEPRSQGQQDAYKKIETKKMTQATSVSQAPPKGKLTLEDMRSMSVKELEAVLPHADLSNRLY